jgi:3-oxoacyl-[acyl-carrier-protein] synthase-3
MTDQQLIRPVYLNASSSFFPNAAVDNDAIENVLGSVGNRLSRSKKIILASNKIKTRYYAIDPVTRKPTHTNAQMSALAVRNLLAENPEIDLSKVGMLAVGTSSPDLLLPAHGQMVQGELNEFGGEVITTSGVCCSGTAAFKAAIMSLRAGDHTSAIVTGSEAASKFMRGEFFESESDAKIEELKKSPMVAFEHDFLRWMLSDGAAAVYLSTEPMAGKQNLRINWIEGRSFANEEAVCLMGGGARDADGSVTAWKDLRLDPEKSQKFTMNIQQDIRQLRDRSPIHLIERTLGDIKKRRGLQPGDFSYFLPHFSSDFFREVAVETMAKIDFAIPQERWFTSLYDRGNVGSAAIFVTIDELLRQKKLNTGDKLLCFVPESARFSVYYFELEVV